MGMGIVGVGIVGMGIVGTGIVGTGIVEGWVIVEGLDGIVGLWKGCGVLRGGCCFFVVYVRKYA